MLASAQRAGIDVELVRPGVPMPTVPLAATAIGTKPEQILKTLLFEDRAGRFVVAIACGTGKIDRARLAAVADLDRPKLAKPETVLAVTGYPAGGVPPIGHVTTLPVVIDARVATLDVAFGGGGVDDVLLRIRIADLIRLSGATVATITVDAAPTL